VRVIASNEAAALVGERGGRLYVRVAGGHCCGGTRHLETASIPEKGREYERVHAGDFEVFFPREARLPDELHLDARRGRVRAYWDGCAWVT
jgi:hypothetical protein